MIHDRHVILCPWEGPGGGHWVQGAPTGVRGLDSVVAWSMRLTDKPLPKGSISHIWHPDREIEGGECEGARDGKGHG